LHKSQLAVVLKTPPYIVKLTSEGYNLQSGVEVVAVLLVLFRAIIVSSYTTHLCLNFDTVSYLTNEFIHKHIFFC